MKPFEYLRDFIKTDIAPSPIHGIGTFALSDIEVGETMFVRWDGESNIYTITKDEFEQLPDYTKQMVLKSYENPPQYPFIWFRLYKDCYWNLANPWAFVNTKEEDGNIHSVDKVALTTIKKGEELFGTYNLENTIL